MVWDPYKIKHITQLEMAQNTAVRFICDLMEVCSISEARESIWKLLSGKGKGEDQRF